MNRRMTIFNRVYDRLMRSFDGVSVNSIKVGSSRVLDALLGVPTFAELLEDAKTALSLIKDFKEGTYRDLSWATVAAVIVALVYLIAPFDFIWDMFPVLGMVDDLLVFRIALAFIQEDLQFYKDWKRNAHIEEATILAEEL